MLNSTSQLSVEKPRQARRPPPKGRVVIKTQCVRMCLLCLVAVTILLNAWMVAYQETIDSSTFRSQATLSPQSHRKILPDNPACRGCPGDEKPWHFATPDVSKAQKAFRAQDVHSLLPIRAEPSLPHSGGSLVHVTVAPLVSTDECAAVITDSEKLAHTQGGWAVKGEKAAWMPVRKLHHTRFHTTPLTHTRIRV